MSKGGAHLLANIASKTDDAQTLRMVAGAIANLCGNRKLIINTAFSTLLTYVHTPSKLEPVN